MDNYIFYNGSRIKNLQGQRFGKLTANKAVEINIVMQFGNVNVIAETLGMYLPNS